MEWVIGIVTGIISGIVASIILSLVLLSIKPKLKISNKICRDDQDKIIYKIKIVNLSKTMLVNLRYSLFYHKSNGHDVSEVIKINPRKDPIDYINRFKNKENYTDYAVRLTFDYDENIYPLNADNFLEFVVFAEHPFSNKGKCFKQFYTISDVEKGKFETGRSTKII